MPSTPVSHISRRRFLYGGALSVATAIGGRHIFSRAQSQPLVGITMSHFEYDFDQIDESGLPQNPFITSLGNDFSVLRFLNWQKTNVTWMQLPPANVNQFWERETREGWRNPPLHPDIDPPSINWGQFAGVPLNVCLRFARELGVRPWICIPHAESAEAFTPLMQTIVDQTIDGTADGLKPIFEFSNEIWNGAFGQQNMCAAIQLGRLPADGGEALMSALAYQTARTNEIAEYAGDRAETIISAQLNNPYIAQTLIGNGLSENVSGVAIAPYIGIVRPREFTRPEILPYGFHPLIDMKTDTPFDLTTPRPQLHDQLLDNLLAYLDAETTWALKEHRTLIDTANGSRTTPLNLIAYESGLDLHATEDNYVDFPPFGAVRELFLEFNRLPHSGFLIHQLRDLFFSSEIGGHLLNGYSSATVYKDRGRKSGNLNYDSFGYLELSRTEPREYSKTAKYDALIGNFPARRLVEGVQLDA